MKVVYLSQGMVGDGPICDSRAFTSHTQDLDNGVARVHRVLGFPPVPKSPASKQASERERERERVE